MFNITFWQTNLLNTLTKNYQTNLWIDLEQNQCNNSVADLAFLPNSIKKMHYFKNVTITSTLTAWWEVNKITNSQLTPCKHTLIWHNPDFQLSNKPIHFPSGQQKGITHLHNLFQENKLAPFKTLIQRYGLGEEQFFQYQQIKSTVKSKINILITHFSPLLNNLLIYIYIHIYIYIYIYLFIYLLGLSVN